MYLGANIQLYLRGAAGVWEIASEFWDDLGQTMMAWFRRIYLLWLSGVHATHTRSAFPMTWSLMTDCYDLDDVWPVGLTGTMGLLLLLQ